MAFLLRDSESRSRFGWVAAPARQLRRCDAAAADTDTDAAAADALVDAHQLPALAPGEHGPGTAGLSNHGPYSRHLLKRHLYSRHTRNRDRADCSLAAAPTSRRRDRADFDNSLTCDGQPRHCCGNSRAKLAAISWKVQSVPPWAPVRQCAKERPHASPPGRLRSCALEALKRRRSQPARCRHQQPAD